MAGAAKFCCLMELEHAPQFNYIFTSFQFLMVSSLPKFGCPESWYVDQAGLKLRYLHTSAPLVLGLKASTVYNSRTYTLLNILYIHIQIMEVKLDAVLPWCNHSPFSCLNLFISLTQVLVPFHFLVPLSFLIVHLKKFPCLIFSFSLYICISVTDNNYTTESVLGSFENFSANGIKEVAREGGLHELATELYSKSWSKK